MGRKPFIWRDAERVAAARLKYPLGGKLSDELREEFAREAKLREEAKRKGLL